MDLLLAYALGWISSYIVGFALLLALVYVDKDKGAGMDMDMGRVACEAWTMIHESNHPGCRILRWDDLPEQEREAWRASADAVVMFRDARPPRTEAGPCYGPNCDHVSHAERDAIIRAQDEAAERM